MAKITKTFVDKVAAPAEGYEVHWDDSVKGYGLRVSAQGKRVFIVMGRVLGKSIQFTLGPYGVLTEDAARKRAQKVLQDMREGIDPRAVVKADAAAKVTLQDVLEAYVGRPGKMKDSTAREYRRHVEKTFAKWAPLPIASITRDMVKERHAALVKGGLEGKKAAPASANAAFVTLRILVRFATDEYRQADGTPLIRDNPVDALKHHWAKLGTRTERYIDRRKIGAVWNKLHAIRGEVQGYEALASVDLTIFLLLTGARRDEAATLTWDRVHIDDHNPAECWWHLDDRKRGDPIWLPLSSQAVALLKSRPRLKLADGTESPFVFPSWGKCGHIRDPRGTFKAVSEAAGLMLSAHDLRRTFLDVGNDYCGIDLLRVQMLMQHSMKKTVTTEHYMKRFNLEKLAPAIQQIGDYIEEQGRLAGIEAAIAAGENVIPMAQRA